MIYSIKGKPDNVKEAESVISEFIANQPDLKNIQLLVPKVQKINSKKSTASNKNMYFLDGPKQTLWKRQNQSS